MVDFGEAADGGEVFRRALEHQLELALRVVELVQLDERAAERDARGEIPGMQPEAGAADVDRFLVLPGAAAFFGELRKRNRRRILLDPASKVFNARVVSHILTARRSPFGPPTLLSPVTVSVTFNVAEYGPAAA